MEETKKCPKCGGAMEEGFILDAGLLGTPVSQQQKWVKGKGKGLSIFGINEGISVKADRCKNCGYLENYAE